MKGPMNMTKSAMDRNKAQKSIQVIKTAFKDKEFSALDILEVKYMTSKIGK